ncbi:MAG: mannitol-1-phosphate 5-dehydrogenase [Candidatus Bathyarchaeia archaeon]
MRKIVIFGAGNIGRSFIGQLFSRSGYEVVFIDVDDAIVNELNERRRYRVEVKDIHPETIWVENVRAVHGRDAEKVAKEIATAHVVATAVGPNNLPHIYANVAKGLLRRLEMGRGPVDIIICENIRDASKIFREGLSKHLPSDYPLDSTVGLVETSIGKMVPIMTEAERRRDPLLVYAEAYNTLIVDKKGFKRDVPKVKGLEAKENIVAYVDRKLLIHNLGHAITAYLGYITDPKMKYIWEAISNKDIRRAVERAMWESGRALIAEHPQEFNEKNIQDYINDLIHRFGNKALGDTIYRVGRDVPRKLSRKDRLIGALLLDAKHCIPAPCTTLGAAAATLFRGKDEKGELYKKDLIFVEEVYPRGIDYILREICGLDFEKERTLIQGIKEAYEFLVRDPRGWPLWLNR